MAELEEGQIVQCTVEKIIGTVVFVKIDEDGEGTIVTSEIAPGRIRNLRDYVIPGKKIVCKILSIKENRIHLSLRRVKTSERKEFLERLDKEKAINSILKTLIANPKEIIDKIKSEKDIVEFFEQAKSNPKILESYFSKDEAEKIMKILESKKEKLKEIKETFKLSNKSSTGINIIKNILASSCQGTSCNISYIAAGKYAIKIQGNNLKNIQNHIDKSLENIEKQAKQTKSQFELIKG